MKWKDWHFQPSVEIWRRPTWKWKAVWRTAILLIGVATITWFMYGAAPSEAIYTAPEALLVGLFSGFAFSGLLCWFMAGD